MKEALHSTGRLQEVPSFRPDVRLKSDPARSPAVDNSVLRWRYLCAPARRPDESAHMRPPFLDQDTAPDQPESLNRAGETAIPVGASLYFADGLPMFAGASPHLSDASSHSSGASPHLTDATAIAPPSPRVPPFGVR